MTHITFETALSTFGRALDMMQGLSLPNAAVKPNGTNGHTNGHTNGNGARKALASPVPAKLKGKPGPKPKTKATPPVVAAKLAPKSKPGPKPKAKAVAGKPKAAAAKPKEGAIAQGRRAVARGERPKLSDAIAIVIGKETMGAAQIIEALSERGWTPNAAKLQSYISFTLSDNSDTFERVSRGLYKVKNPAAFKDMAKAGKPSGKAERVASTSTGETKAAPKKAPPAIEAAPASDQASDPPSETAPISSKAIDDTLESLGIGKDGTVASNPFNENSAVN